MRRGVVFSLAALMAGALGNSCVLRVLDASDPLFHLDVFDIAKPRAAEIVPLAPWIQPGPDGELGTNDDAVVTVASGDVDLVLRTGSGALGTTIAPPLLASGVASLPEGASEPFGAGQPVTFSVAAVHGGATPPALDLPIVSPSLEGVPVLVLAFPDLDGDGFIGVTNLDGNAWDAEIENAELQPVGRRLVFASASRATGSLVVSAGGPAASPLLVALGAVAYAGRFDPAYLNGAVPNGPAVMTRLPLLPRLKPQEILDGGGVHIEPADPNGLVGVEFRMAVVPNPNDPRVGESFTLLLDGSDPTLDGARSRAGSFARFAALQPVSAGTYRFLPKRALVAGLDDAGARAVYERTVQLFVADDAGATTSVLRIAPLDRLGNVTDIAAPALVTLRMQGTARIVSPDTDGDPSRENVSVADARGTDVLIDDAGAVFDDPNSDLLTIEGAGALSLLAVTSPDPDVDDSGVVDASDVAIVAAARGESLGDPGYDPAWDQDGDGRIDVDDEDLVTASLGNAIPVP